MNQSYKIIDNKVLVYDDCYYESVRDLTTNIEDILITENNIEIIKNLMQYELNNNNLNMPKLVISSFSTISSAYVITGIFRLLTEGLSPSLGFFLMGVTFGTLSYPLGIKPYLKEKKKLELKSFILEDALTHEKEKLNRLNYEKINDSKMVTEPTNLILISKEIKILKTRLNDIKSYMDNRHKFIKLYKKGNLFEILQESNVPQETIEFIKKLIELDLQIENNKQKTLRK